jgi:pyruvate formate-lyase activating enzyme-like uncharacterized protein
MTIAASRKEQWIQKNKNELGPAYAALNWITPEAAQEAALQRDSLLASLQKHAVMGCHNTKVDCQRLSPGCERCTQGTWSCLFVHSRCNSRCFYCPSPQDEDLLPMTNTVPFAAAGDYVDYIRVLDFKGVSLSGGEPLLVLDTSLAFLRAIKEAFGQTVHTWLYTNGILATREILLQLKEAGLDEIRFDIGATGMRLDAAKTAVGLIDTVTVEIPALPEEDEIMKTRIREMDAAGIAHLNLHQLRLTPYNLPRLQNRGYTFVHGERVTVLESELAALRWIQWAHEEGIALPINYCSFVYKNRFQRAAARRRSAGLICKPHETITQSGYIRTLELLGEPDALRQQAERLQEAVGEGQWKWGPKHDRLWIVPALWPRIQLITLQCQVSYAEAKILPQVTYRNYFVEIPLNPHRSLYVEKIPVSQKIELSPDLMHPLYGMGLGQPSPSPLPEPIQSFETIEDHLAEYF